MDMNTLDMPKCQTSSIHEMHTSRSQRDDSLFIKQKLLDMTFAHLMSLQCCVLLQLGCIIRTNMSLQQIVSRIRSHCATVDGQKGSRNHLRSIKALGGCRMQ